MCSNSAFPYRPCGFVCYHIPLGSPIHKEEYHVFAWAYSSVLTVTPPAFFRRLDYSVLCLFLRHRQRGIVENTINHSIILLGGKLGKLQQKHIDIKAVDAIEAKPIPLSSKVMLSPEDYKTLSTAAKKYVVQEKKERKLQKLLDAAEKTISNLKAKISELTTTISSLTKEIDEYRSVRGQLDHGKLKQENKELRQQNSFLKSLIEQHGLSHLLGRGRERQKPSKQDYVR